MSSTLRIGFLGAGQMATALARGIFEAQMAAAKDVAAADPDEGARRRFGEAIPGASVGAENREVARRSEVLVLAVKPHVAADVLRDLQGETANKLIISVAAGVRLEPLQAAADPAARVIRVMPNTPCLVGMGASAYSLGSAATEEDGQLVERLLSAVGEAWPVPERLLDAVTGLSGSGPAFVYTVIEALSDGGVAVGLPRPLAHALATSTVRGAAEMVHKTGEHPAVLRDRVASPGGTTIAGLCALEAGAFKATLIEAVAAATRRSAELGRTDG
jgi:pyrroline-5-carboxylate reductase